ncbi:MAG: TetR/AcrR family transcriptional regulator [Marinisporobacter sp.]|jgi:AcrR family transcriptional regulator|nr:TetR/AcrR family transcriptional regulator [Marinisporobacter sp.]
MSDKRTTRTKELIRDSFLYLLSKKDVSKIKVTEIVDLAGIGRGTFYLHFLDVYDLYEQIESELYEDLAVFIDEVFTPVNGDYELLLLSKNLINYIDEHKKVFALFTRDKNYKDSDTKFRQLVTNRVIQGYLDDPNTGLFYRII